MLCYAPGHPFVVGLHFAFVSEHSSYTPPTHPSLTHHPRREPALPALRARLIILHTPPIHPTPQVSEHCLHFVLDYMPGGDLMLRLEHAGCIPLEEARALLGRPPLDSRDTRLHPARGGAAAHNLTLPPPGAAVHG